MWIIDIRHWLDESHTGPAVPQLKRKVERLQKIIVIATSDVAAIPMDTYPKCDRRPGRKPCKGQLIIEQVAEDEIYWACPLCGDEGIVTGWQDLFWNATSYCFNDTTH